MQPMLLRVRETPTRIIINGDEAKDWPHHLFALIYVTQCFYALCCATTIFAYDGVFILIAMSLRYRFRVLAQLLLSSLSYPGPRDHRKDRRILLDIYKIHLSVLE